MKNIWEKIKSFFSRIWNGLTRAGRIVLALIIVLLIGTVVYAATYKKEDKPEDNKEGDVEVAQVYEPSIGTPLPPDVPVETPAAISPGTVAGITSDPSFMAPPTGIDDNEPIKYSNSSFKFGAILPPHSQVNEQENSVTFSNAKGDLLYTVSTHSAESETLTSIESQLRNSPTASTISPTTFANTKALSFTAKGFGTGTVFIAHGTVYYILGDANQMSSFSLQ